VRCYHYSSEMRNEIYRVDHAREWHAGKL
jgi:hypothetical protein